MLDRDVLPSRLSKLKLCSYLFRGPRSNRGGHVHEVVVVRDSQFAKEVVVVEARHVHVGTLHVVVKTCPRRGVDEDHPDAGGRGGREHREQVQHRPEHWD